MMGTIEPAHRYKPWLEEDEHLEAIDAWLRRRPGVFGPRTTATECWQEALAALGTRCGLGFFRSHLRRIGYGIEKGSGGFRLDLSDSFLVEEA